MKYIILLALSMSLQGCLVSKAVGVATAPVRVAGKAVDVATTSQSEADEKRGKNLRKQEERLGNLQRDKNKADRKCARGDQKACDDAQDIADDIAAELDRAV